MGQKIGDRVYKGFKPDKLNKSGYFELYSDLMKIKGFPALPTYVPIPEHEKMGPNELILTTYKIAVQTHSRTANCKWLTEIYHDNPAKINPATAKELGIKEGDKIKVKSAVAEITTTVNVTEGVVPGTVAISHHLGHWEYGRYASGKRSPAATEEPHTKFNWWRPTSQWYGGTLRKYGEEDPDVKLKPWKTYGVHPNWAIPNSPDPINGQQRWMDTVVRVSKG